MHDSSSTELARDEVARLAGLNGSAGCGGGAAAAVLRWESSDDESVGGGAGDDDVMLGKI